MKNKKVLIIVAVLALIAVIAGGIYMANPKNRLSLKYDWVSSIDGEFFKVQQDDKWGIVDKSGDVVLDIKYEALSNFFSDEDIATITIDGKMGYVNKYGKILVAPLYDDARISDGKIAAVKLGDKWGFIDMEGNKIIDFIYDELGENYSYNGHLILKKDGFWGAINETGEEIIPFTGFTEAAVKGRLDVMFK